MRYVLEGSVRKTGNRVRITAQLDRHDDQTHISGLTRFDGCARRIFGLQDQAASSVVGAIEPRLRLSEIERATYKQTESLDAYDLYLHALAQFNKYSRKACEQRTLLKRALAIDPSYASAAAMFGFCRPCKEDGAGARSPKRISLRL